MLLAQMVPRTCHNLLAFRFLTFRSCSMKMSENVIMLRMSSNMISYHLIRRFFDQNFALNFQGLSCLGCYVTTVAERHLHQRWGSSAYLRECL